MNLDRTRWHRRLECKNIFMYPELKFCIGPILFDSKIFWVFVLQNARWQVNRNSSMPSMFSVCFEDKGQLNYFKGHCSLLLQYEILKKLVTFILLHLHYIYITIKPTKITKKKEACSISIFQSGNLTYSIVQKQTKRVQNKSMETINTFKRFVSYQSSLLCKTNCQWYSVSTSKDYNHKDGVYDSECLT